MRSLIRRLAVWAALLSLLGGVWLPFGAGSAVADGDGICGPVLVIARSVRHFEATHPPARDQHCLFCHWRHTMSSAAASAIVAVAMPIDPGLSVAGYATAGPDLVVIGSPSPRGPPVLS
jgi:hypothetical protein